MFEGRWETSFRPLKRIPPESVRGATVETSRFGKVGVDIKFRENVLRTPWLFQCVKDGKPVTPSAYSLYGLARSELRGSPYSGIRMEVTVDDDQDKEDQPVRQER